MLAAITRVLDAAGRWQVPDDVLGEPMEYRVTELDGLPATVCDVLFGEIV